MCPFSLRGSLLPRRIHSTTQRSTSIKCMEGKELMKRPSISFYSNLFPEYVDYKETFSDENATLEDMEIEFAALCEDKKAEWAVTKPKVSARGKITQMVPAMGRLIYEAGFFFLIKGVKSDGMPIGLFIQYQGGTYRREFDIVTKLFPTIPESL